MRLFLSSENLGNYPEVFLRMLSHGKLALVENAKDYYNGEDRRTKVEGHNKQFKEQGFDIEDLDLKDYFGSPKKLAKKMSQFNGMFVFGGNTFILRRAMAASGLDKILQDLVPNEKLAYGGSSAGSMVMSPDLKGPIWSQEYRSNIIPEGYDTKVIWQGLNLVPFYIVPHFGSEIHGNSPQKLADYYESKKLRHYILKDGQVLVVDGKKEELLK